MIVARAIRSKSLGTLAQACVDPCATTRELEAPIAHANFFLWPNEIVVNTRDR